jgi:hypothetical protein
MPHALGTAFSFEFLCHGAHAVLLMQSPAHFDEVMGSDFFSTLLDYAHMLAYWSATDSVFAATTISLYHQIPK